MFRRDSSDVSGFSSTGGGGDDDGDDGGGRLDGEGGRRYKHAGETNYQGGGGGGGSRRQVHAEDDDRDSKARTSTAPLLNGLDPAVTAAILTQAAFRGYRLRDRLRHLPAREAEKTIRALQANGHGFRRLALFLVFFGLYFSLVFGGADVAFQRSVQQGLRDHLALVKYGPEKDRAHTDVTSLSDVFQWMQAFYLTTYHGTQLEDRCTACAVKPPDEVCNACDFELYDATVADPSVWFAGRDSASDEQARRRAAAVDNSRSSSSSSRSRSSSSSSSSGSNSLGLSEECGACVLGRLCTGRYLEICAASLDDNTSSASPSTQEESDALGDMSSASSSASSTLNASTESTLNVSALSDLILEPAGGVTAAAGYVVVENASQCSSLLVDVGMTENLARFNADLEVPFNGIGYVANRNRVIGGMLVKFARRKRVPEENCAASRDYIHICLEEEESKETIIPGGAWRNFRPDTEIAYNEVAGGYIVLLGTGGFNAGLNLGMCALLVMEDLDVIPRDEVQSVSVQLVTYNGNQKSAYGSISIDFYFEDGGEVAVKDTISAYTVKSKPVLSGDRPKQVSMLLFVCMLFGMMWHDTCKWWRLRHSKAKRNRCHRVCGFAFFALMVLTIVLWSVWSLVLASTIAFDTEFRGAKEDSPSLSSVADEVVALHRVALFVATYYFVFVLTTMAALYRWIFQILTFHKRMSIVADTLSRASTHLDHFLFVFFLVMMVFTNLTWLLVGSSSNHFSTPGEAWRSVIRVSLGESENFYPQILAAQPTVGPVIVVLYQVLGVVLLLNVVIAVLLEAYRGVVGGMRDEDTILQSLIAFIGMTLCTEKARIQWADAYLRWSLSKGRTRQARRPSLKVAIQGSACVSGVDGRPVFMVRRPSASTLSSTEKQLSYNCARHITVTEMQALIQATPVPAFIADRLVRKIVFEWIFESEENLSTEKAKVSYLMGYGIGSGSGDASAESVPMLRQRDLL